MNNFYSMGLTAIIILNSRYFGDVAYHLRSWRLQWRLNIESLVKSGRIKCLIRCKITKVIGKFELKNNKHCDLPTRGIYTTSWNFIFSDNLKWIKLVK